MLSGCSVETSNVIPPKEENQFEELVVNNLKYEVNENCISYNIENKGNIPIYTGMAYYIEQYNESSGWIKTDLTDNLAFIEIAIVIEPEKNYLDRIDLSNMGKLKDGYYRIVKEFIINENKILQYIQIEVKNNEVMNMKSYNEKFVGNINTK